MISFRKLLVSLGKLVIFISVQENLFRRCVWSIHEISSYLCQFPTFLQFPNIILVTYWYIKIHPQIKCCQMTSIYYLTMSVGQQAKSSFTRCLWFRIFPVVAVRLLGGNGGGCCIPTGQLDWVAGGREGGGGLTSCLLKNINFFTSWACLPGCLLRWQLAFPKGDLSKREWKTANKIEVILFLQSNLGHDIPLLLPYSLH